MTFIMLKFSPEMARAALTKEDLAQVLKPERLIRQPLKVVMKPHGKPPAATPKARKPKPAAAVAPVREVSEP